MNTLDACKLIVRHFPGGLDVVAMRLAKSPSTLEKELRNASGYKLGVLDAEAISCMAIEAQSPHCHAYVNATATGCGGFIELHVRDDMTEPVQTSIAGLVKEAADVLMAATAKIPPNGRLSDNASKEINRELSELLAQIQKVQRGMKSAKRAQELA